MIFKVFKPSGFIAKRERVTIFDLCRPNIETPFYDFDFSERENINDRRFNLPVGMYETENDLIHSYFKESNNFQIPEPEIFRPLPFSFPIIYESNPNKASIDFRKRVITIDPSFIEKPRYDLDFIISHEYGHFIYRTEKFADLYSMKRMLKKGYNKSQIRTAINESLTKQSSNKRKKFIEIQTNKASL